MFLLTFWAMLLAVIASAAVPTSPLPSGVPPNFRLLKRPRATSSQPAATYDSLLNNLTSDCATFRGPDSTEVVQRAIDAAAEAGGRSVDLPAGCFTFAGALIVSPGVTLRGTYDAWPPSHDLRGANPTPLTDGTVLVPTAGRGLGGEADDVAAFLTVEGNAAVQGLVVFHAFQERNATPVAYPWAVSLVGNNAAVSNVELLGAWNGVRAVGAGRHYVGRVQGQPLNIGVLVDKTYDIGRVEDVHFNPWFSSEKPLMRHQLTYGRAFVFGRSDWEYVFNTFSFGYAVGYQFVRTKDGAMNGNFLGIGADLCPNASVLVEDSQAPGVLITNGEFTAFRNDAWLPGATVESAHVRVLASNNGPVKFVGSSFWGPASEVAVIDGAGSVTFSACQFVEWDEQARDGRAAIRVVGPGALVLNGNEFAQNKVQVDLGPAVSKAVVVGNIINGPLRIAKQGNKTNLQVAANAFDSTDEAIPSSEASVAKSAALVGGATALALALLVAGVGRGLSSRHRRRRHQTNTTCVPNRVDDPLMTAYA